ncbi:MAG: twin-arginine translocase TatA/TatE family subunit [Salinivirgaceae bacterium]
MNTILISMPGGGEWTIIFLAILLLFGGKKIPELMKGIGQGIREFKKAANDSEVGKDIKDIKKEVNSVSQDIKDNTRL